MFLVFFFFRQVGKGIAPLRQYTLHRPEWQQCWTKPFPLPLPGLLGSPIATLAWLLTNSTVITLKKGNRNLSGCENFKPKIKKKSLFHFLWSARESFFSTTHTLFSWTNFDLPIASCPIILWQSSNAPLRTNLECRTIHNTELKSPKFGYWKIKNRLNLWNPPAIYNPHCRLKCRCGQGDFAILVEKPRRLSWRRAKLLKYLVCCVQDRER